VDFEIFTNKTLATRLNVSNKTVMKLKRNAQCIFFLSMSNVLF